MAERRIKQSERAHRHLMAEIRRGRWQTGDTVSTYALAEELDMSRTPILAALKQLETEGLVEIIPQVGCRIVRPDSSDVGELFALRGVLDGAAAAAAAQRIDADALSDLEGLLGRLEAVAGRGDRGAFGELDQRFHFRIIDASRMPRLAQMARSVWSPLRAELSRVPLPREELDGSTAEHREIYEALTRRAPEAARAAAERHATRAAARFAADLRRGLGATSTHEGFVHQALIYATDEEFLAAAVPFVSDALRDGERVLAVTTKHNARLLERELGPRAEQIELRDAGDWYQEPSSTLRAYQTYVAEHANGGRVRIIGEPVWTGLSPAEITEWTRYESSLNIAFAVAPVSLLCPYDARALPDQAIAVARLTHPEILAGTDSSPSAEYADFFAPVSDSRAGGSGSPST